MHTQVHSLHVKQTRDEQNRLDSLTDMRRRATMLRRARRAKQERIKKRAKPLALVTAEVKSKRVPIPMPLVESFDQMLNEVDRMAQVSPTDAAVMAKTLLGAALRVAWWKCSGKANTNPDPATVPVRLFQRQAVDKSSMRQMINAISKAIDVDHMQVCTKALIQWIASDEPHAITGVE